MAKLRMCSRCGMRPARNTGNGWAYCRWCESLLSAVRYFNKRRAELGQDWANRYIARKAHILEGLQAINLGRKLPK